MRIALLSEVFSGRMGALGPPTSGNRKEEPDLRLQSDSLADIYPPPPFGDDIVNFLDFAVLAENWLAGK